MAKIQITMSEEQAKRFLEPHDCKDIISGIENALFHVIRRNYVLFVDEKSGIKAEKIEE